MLNHSVEGQRRANRDQKPRSDGQSDKVLDLQPRHLERLEGHIHQAVKHTDQGVQNQSDVKDQKSNHDESSQEVYDFENQVQNLIHCFSQKKDYNRADTLPGEKVSQVAH